MVGFHFSLQATCYGKSLRACWEAAAFSAELRGYGSTSAVRQAAGFEVWPHHMSAVGSWLITSLPVLQCLGGDNPIQ